jgi:hypothetical protein
MLKRNPPEGFIDITVTTGTEAVEGYDTVYTVLPRMNTVAQEKVLQTK